MSGIPTARRVPVRYVLPSPQFGGSSQQQQHTTITTHQQQQRWTTSTVFGLFLLLMIIATINVSIVSVVWESFAKLDAEEQHAKDAALESSSSQNSQSFRSVSFVPRKVTAEDWTRTRLRCRYEDCVRAKDSTQGAPWSEQDFKACTSALFLPRGASGNRSGTSNDIIPMDSACVRKVEAEETTESPETSCRRSSWKNNGLNHVVVLVEEPRQTSDESFFRDAVNILRNDETFPVGLGANLMITANRYADWDIKLRAVPNQEAARLHIDEEFVVDQQRRCKKRKTTITLNSNAKAHPNALYGKLRHAMVQIIQNIRPIADVRLAVMLVWAGTKPPPEQLLDVARAFVKSDPEKVTCLIMIEGQYANQFSELYKNNKLMASFQYKEKIRLIHHYDEESKGNLTHFIHSRSDMLVPEIKGHHHYTLGWSLCDFRWLFGAIFERFIPESEFTHWAWGDSDAFPGKLFGPVSDYGYDFSKHDVTSFAAVVLERNAPASSMMAYSSGTFTAIKNTKKGRALFHHTPKEKLLRGLTRPSNGILDEVGTSNGVFSAPNVSIALISSQARVAGTIFDESTGRLYIVANDATDSRTLQKLQNLGRVSEPYALAPMGFATVLARFAGGESLPGQVRYVHPDDKVRWYSPPHVNPDNFLNLLAPGTGFAVLLKDENGYWWNRPLPFQFSERTRSRQHGDFAESRPVVRVEMGIVHSRLGGPCVVQDSKEIASFDWALASAGAVEKPRSVNFASKQCQPFKKFFHAV